MEDCDKVIINMCVLHGFGQSDHIPVAAEIDFLLVPDTDHGTGNRLCGRIDCSTQTDEDIYVYGLQSDLCLRSVELAMEALLCKDCGCTRVDHREVLNNFYADI